MHDAHPGPVPPREAIELRCDTRTAGRVARAALARQFRGWTGVVAVGTSSALGTIVSIGEGSWAVGLCYGLVTLALQVGWLAWSARRATRRAMPPGLRLVSRYEPSGLLLVSTGLERSAVPWSSFRSCTRSRGGVFLTFRAGGTTSLPGALFPPAELARLQQLVREHGRA